MLRRYFFVVIGFAFLAGLLIYGGMGRHVAVLDHDVAEAHIDERFEAVLVKFQAIETQQADLISRLEHQEEVLQRLSQEWMQGVSVAAVSAFQDDRSVSHPSLSLPDQMPDTNQTPVDPLQRYESLVDSVFAEPVDAQWSRQVSEEILKNIRLVDDQAAITSIDCASTKCFGRVTHTDMDAAARFASTFYRQFPPNRYVIELVSDRETTSFVLMTAAEVIAPPDEFFPQN